MINKSDVDEILKYLPTENKAEEDNSINKVQELNVSNVVTQDKLRKIQSKTLNLLSEYISKTFGPMASNTQIITGDSGATIQSKYSKDGLRVLKRIQFSQPIEMSIESEIVDIASFVEKKVGDGTTSSVILSSLIFNGLMNLENENKIPPRKLVSLFQSVVSELQTRIKKNKKDITLDDIYEIAMISTNGNSDVSTQIKSLYEKYGFDVSIDVGVSNDENSKVKVYDGLTVNEGYSDIAYVNNTLSGTADIHDAHIYAFADPIDTPEMINFMEKIISDNILNHVADQEYVPTVIISPIITRDASALLGRLVSTLYEFDNQKMESQKPPILIITNLGGVDEEIYNDIAMLCHCKMIRKYIDPKIQEEDQKKGEAPTFDNITQWYGTAELVSADNDKTKFINPKALTTEDDHTYDRLKNFLTAEINKAKLDNDNALKVGRLKKRLRCLEANMIEYLVGGINAADRDSTKDLVEDAVKNIASATDEGVGRAANFEGLIESYHLSYELAYQNAKNHSADSIMKQKICAIIFNAYYEASKILYESVVDSETADDIIISSMNRNKPYNVIDIFEQYNSSVKFSNSFIYEKDRVLCSINTDIEILAAISRIITLMVTSNQCLLQVPSLNRY